MANNNTPVPDLLKPYKILSNIYDANWGVFALSYVPLLMDLKDRNKLKLTSVLDLACGTGSLIKALIPYSNRLVGIDISEDMVKKAKDKLAGDKQVELSIGDFRSFSLAERFTVVLCCYDAINYVSSLDEFGLFVRNAREHLIPGGYLVFDATTEANFTCSNGLIQDFAVRGVNYRFESHYDPVARINRSRFLFRDGLEIHSQIPIEKTDVEKVSKDDSFPIEAIFSDFKGNRIFENAKRLIYVLRKQ